MIKPILVSSGEPAGIGPDLCLALAASNYPLVVLGDKQLLAQRAAALKLDLSFIDYRSDHAIDSKPGSLCVYSIPCPIQVHAGQLNVSNAAYVINMLELAVNECLAGNFSALVTGPVHKGIINEAGIQFTGHTEFLAKQCQVDTVVMMLASPQMKVGLITTHLPLKDVPAAINHTLIIRVIQQLNISLKQYFNIANPCIYVAGLNPHAGEGGHLGREEIEIINPALMQLKEQGINVHGPFSADTLFTPSNSAKCDVFVTMYHDQGLGVLKYASFGSAVNVTLGLPIIRTSVDHGTALELAGTQQANPNSLKAAVEMAFLMANSTY